MKSTVASLWLVLSMSVRVSPKQAALSALEVLSQVMRVFQPLFLAWFITGVARHDTTQIVLASLGFGGTQSIAWMFMVVGNTARLNQRERVGFAFDTEIARLAAAVPTLDHLESASYLDELQVLRDQEGALGNALNSVLNTVNNLSYAAGTVALAVTADWRLLLLAVAGLPNILTARWSIGWQKAAEKASAEPGRRANHLTELGTTPAGAAEIRVFGVNDVIGERLRGAVHSWRSPYVRSGTRNAAAGIANAVIFYGTAGAVLGWMLHDVGTGAVATGAVVLAVVLIGRLQAVGMQIQWSVRMLSEVVRTANRFRWLRTYHDQVVAAHPGTRNPPQRLSSGIRTEGLSYHYPGEEAAALEDVALTFPAGSVVALVGENGAGKSTLIKLLTGMYRPSAGRVLIDDTDLAEFDLQAWRQRLSGAFQDFAKLEFTALETVGVGDVPHVRDEPRVHQALRDGASEAVLTALPERLQTRLGASWPGGVDLSGGQWQRLAIARGMMRSEPLLLILDEPTAALDPTAEHELFERYAAAARQAGGRGAVTILVTHRFSTVASADLVVVLQHGRVSEVGSHAQLMAAGGHYAELYELQARGYR